MNRRTGKYMGKEKVVVMPTLARKESSRSRRLQEAKKLSDSITKRTNTAGLDASIITRDVRAVYRDVKNNRSGSNRH